MTCSTCLWEASILFALSFASSSFGHGAVSTHGDVRLEFPDDIEVVELPFRSTGNKILIPLRINGAGPFEFVLDTGASLGLLTDKEAIAELDLETRGAGRAQGAGSGAGVAIAMASDLELGLGPIRLTNASLAVTQELGALGPAPWQGIIGRQVFDNLVVEIDWTTERLSLRRPSQFEPDPDAASLALRRGHQGHVFLNAEVETSAGESEPVELVVDTGAYHALALDPAQLAPGPRHISDVPLGRGLNGLLTGDVGRIERLLLGRFELQDVLVRYPTPDVVHVVTSGSAGNLGVETLRRFHVTVDLPGRRMLLVPNDSFEDAFRFSTTGISTQPWLDEDGNVSIDHVLPGSAADTAGVTVEDRIVGVDSIPMTQLELGALRERLQAEPGTSLELELSRGGETRRVTLRTARIL